MGRLVTLTHTSTVIIYIKPHFYGFKISLNCMHKFSASNKIFRRNETIAVSSITHHSGTASLGYKFNRIQILGHVQNKLKDFNSHPNNHLKCIILVPGSMKKDVRHASRGGTHREEACSTIGNTRRSRVWHAKQLNSSQKSYPSSLQVPHSTSRLQGSESEKLFEPSISER